MTASPAQLRALSSEIANACHGLLTGIDQARGHALALQRLVAQIHADPSCSPDSATRRMVDLTGGAADATDLIEARGLQTMVGQTLPTLSLPEMVTIGAITGAARALARLADDLADSYDDVDEIQGRSLAG